MPFGLDSIAIDHFSVSQHLIMISADSAENKSKIIDF